MAKRVMGARSARYGAVVTWVALAMTVVFGRWRRVSVLTLIAEALVPRLPVQTARGVLTLYTPSKSAVYWARGGYDSEPDTLRWLDSFTANAVLMDVGASVGIYAMYAALRPDIRVFAFEANPFTYRCLIANLHENGLSERVAAYCLAVSDRAMISSYYAENTDAGTVGNAFDNPSTSTVRPSAGPVAIPMIGAPIDDLVERFGVPVPDHIKIDVDSIEHLIVAGARRTLANPKVASVLIEITRGTPERDARAAQIVAAMREAGFVVDPAVTSRGGNTLFVRG